MALQNVGTYGFSLAAAHMLGPRDYGEVAALMGLMLVLQVVSLGLQATGARRVSASPGTQHSTEQKVLRATLLAAAGVGLLTLLPSPFTADVLRLDSVWPVALLAAATVPLTLMGGYAGIFQGERRWCPLAAIYLAVGAGRIACGVLGMLWREDVVGAMAGVAVGNLLPALVGRWAIRHPDRSTAAPSADAAGAAAAVTERSLLTEMAHNSHALLAFFALTNTDVLIARVVLDDRTGGLYAAGLILTKAVLFLPQFVVVLAFPSMAAGRRRMQNQALLVILAIGAAATVGVVLLAPLAVLFVGGDAYSAVQPLLWAFAALGTLLAMIQLVVYGTVARQHRGAVVVLWLGLAALLVSGAGVTSVSALLGRVLVVQLAVLLALIVLTNRHLHRTAASTAPPDL